MPGEGRKKNARRRLVWFSPTLIWALCIRAATEAGINKRIAGDIGWAL